MVATSAGSPFAVIADEGRRFYGVQFHPEVAHTPRGALFLRNFVRRRRGPDRRLDHGRLPRRSRCAASASRSGAGRVICGLSGGVDSSVAAVLIHEAIGDQLTCVFVDTACCARARRRRS